MKDPITGKVARIVNSREVVLNRGEEHGVAIGTRFAVLDPGGENVTDPDTGDILGSIQRTKVEVEVTQVGERISIAQTFRFEMINEGGSGLGGGGELARMFTPRKLVRQYETLKLSDVDWEPISEQDSIVEVGDPVVQVMGTTTEAPTAGVIAPPLRSLGASEDMEAGEAHDGG